MSVMDTKVNKSGDTMTGNLILNSCNLVLKNKNYRLLEAWDSKGATTTTLETYRDSDTKARTVLFAFNPSDNSKNAQLELCQDGDAKWATCPASNGNNTIVTTVSHGSRYVRFGNGLQICWGVGTGVQVFPQPFRDTDYMIADSDLTYHKYEGMWTTNKTTTQFEIKNSGQAQWIAIGYWY